MKGKSASIFDVNIQNPTNDDKLVSSHHNDASWTEGVNQIFSFFMTNDLKIKEI